MGRFRRVMWSEDITRMRMWISRGARIDELLRVRIDRRDLGGWGHAVVRRVV
jgi:hypothetical protein